MRYLTTLGRNVTPQTEPIPGSTQGQNSAGGYSWEVSPWMRLSRFLILGSEGGSYYAAEGKLTRENASAVELCIAEDGERVVREIVAVSEGGRAAKNDPALFALAMCAGLGDEATRRAAFAALPRVARIGTHLFHFAAFVEGFRGWGRGLRGAVGRWYNLMPASDLALQAVKYGSRDGWSHRDLLRLAHPKTEDETRNALYGWIVDGWKGVGPEPHPDPVLKTLWAYETAMKAETGAEVARLVREYRLPMEATPTDKRTREVWEALLPHAGLTFLIRSLGNLSKVGLLTKGEREAIQTVTERITDASALRKARVHPIQVLAALTTYGSGQGARGNGAWEVVPDLMDALDTAFYRAFDNVKPTGKRWLLALDVSGSMGGGSVAGVPGLSPRIASAAMAMVTLHTEPTVEMLAFADKLIPLNLSRKKRLDEVVKSISGLPFGATDCAQPMLWALKQKVAVDVFVVYTDSETWHGGVHPVQALRDYRERTGIPARLIVVGMVANKFSIADPNDAGMLDIVGFDTAAPEVMRQFAAGEC